MQTIYFDWSIRRGVAALREGKDEVRLYPSLTALLDDIKEPSRIIGETTFESFNLDNRKEVIKRCDAEGHELLTVPNRQTSRFRKAAGLGEKSDEVDVTAIRLEVLSGMHLKVPGEPDARRVELHREMSKFIMDLRSHGEMRERPRSPGYEFHPLKTTWAQRLATELPDFKSQPEVRRLALGDGKAWNLTAVAAIGAAAQFAETTRDFDYLSGMYAHAYPAQVRADLMHWVYSGGSKRGKLDGVPEDGIRKRKDGLSLSDFRRECRWLYHHLKEVAKLDL